MAVAVVVAAGQGKRLGHPTPKAFIDLAGKPVVSWALEAFATSPLISKVALVYPAGFAPDEPLLRRAIGCSTHTCAAFAEVQSEIVCVPGGTERGDSVKAGVDSLAQTNFDVVAIHDGARPLVSQTTIQACLEAAQNGEVSIAAAQITDTVKRVKPTSTLIEETVDRSLLWGAQTPQVFTSSAIRQVLELPPAQLAAATDEASLAESIGLAVEVVTSERSNMKVTVPEDLELVELLLKARSRRCDCHLREND